MTDSPKRPPTQMQSLKQLLLKYDLDNTGKYISREFQEYGYRLAVDLDDVRRAGMYIKFAKTLDRSLLEICRNFVKDAPNVKNKTKLFLWKLKQVKDEQKNKSEK